MYDDFGSQETLAERFEQLGSFQVLGAFFMPHNEGYLVAR